MTIHPKQHILVVLPFVPSISATQAGHRIAFETLQKLALGASVDVALILSSADCEEIIVNDDLGIEGVAVKYVQRTSRLSFLAAGLKYLPYYFRFCSRANRKASKNLLTLIRSASYDAVRLEFSQCFIYAADIRDEYPEICIILSVHDLQSQVVLRKPWWERIFFLWAFTSEKRLLECATRIAVLSAKDKVLVQSLLDVGRDTFIEPPPLSAFVENVERLPGLVEPNSLMFWGAMNRVENETAVIAFVKHIFLPLRKAGYEYKLYIVGSKPSAKVLALSGPDIVVTGFVDDPSSYFRQAALGVVPLLSGAGIKLKTLEMLRVGMPVLATPVGAEGVDASVQGLSIRSFDHFEAFLRKFHSRSAGTDTMFHE